MKEIAHYIEKKNKSCRIEKKVLIFFSWLWLNRENWVEYGRRGKKNGKNGIIIMLINKLETRKKIREKV